MANIEHSTNFFLQVSSFTRHLLDDILPVEVYGKPDVPSVIIDNLIKECDNLSVSLQNFKMRRNLQVNKTSLNGGVGIKSHVLFNALCEAILENTVSITDIVKYRPFYCEICNLATCKEDVFNEHIASVKHLEQADKVAESIAVYKCTLCHLYLIARQSEVISVKLLSSHWKLDENVRRLKEKNEIGLGKKTGSNTDLSKSAKTVSGGKKSEANVVTSQSNAKSAQNITGSSIVQSKANELASNLTKGVTPPKVKQALKLMRKKLRIDRRFPETVLHYCYICDVVVNSITSYIQHNSSKQHIAAINNATKIINLFKCDKCKILITGYPDVIDTIINSDLHKEVDEWVKTIKTTQLQKSDTSKIISSGTESSSATQSPAQQNSTQMPIPYDLKNGLSFIYEKVTTANHLKKHSPSYCFVCERAVDSFHNFQQHVKAKQHKLLCSVITQSLCYHQCTVCLMTIFGTECEIDNVVKSIEHVRLDKKIDNLFKNNIKTDSIRNSPVDAVKISKETNTASPVNVQKITKTPEPKIITPTSSNKNVIPTKFFTYNAKLLSGCFKKSGYCRPCNKGVIIKSGWAIHSSCKKHIMKTTETEYNKNLTPLRCKYCPLQILGDQQHGNVCMDAHVKLNHPDEKTLDTRNNIDQGTDLNQSTVITTQQFINSSIANDSNNLAKLQETNTNPINSIAQPILDEMKIQDSPKHLPTSTSNLDIFINFLKKKKTIFLDEGLKQFGGMCLLCSMTFEDYYGWLIHVKGATHRDVQQASIYERECEKCNMNLYGEKSVIDNELWSIEEHLALDTLIAQ